jgi:hypothetical protein
MAPNAPSYLGKEVELRMFDDSDHVGVKATCRSCTGYILYMNMTMMGLKLYIALDTHSV